MKKPRNALSSPLKRGYVTVLGNEKYQNITVPLFAILLSLLAAAIVLLMMGKNPLTAFWSFLQGSGIAPKPSYAGKKGMITDLAGMLNLMTPMLFAALAVAVALKTGLFNIGISGQMLVPGFIASITVGYSDLPMGVAMPLVLIIGIVGGGAAGALIGWLKHRFNINEVVSSIMLNYIFSYIISFFINSYFIDPLSRQSRAIESAARLTLTGVELGSYKLDLPLGFLLAVPMAVFIKFLMDRTRAGYEMKVVGLNRRAAEYAGINVGKNVVLAMAISGALAGLAGVTYYLGYFNSIQPKALASMGFDSIAVCLLGGSEPIGIIFSSLLITIISKGSNYMSSTLNVPQEISQLITGLILLFSACGAFIKYRVGVIRDELRDLEQDGSDKEGGERV